MTTPLHETHFQIYSSPFPPQTAKKIPHIQLHINNDIENEGPYQINVYTYPPRNGLQSHVNDIYVTQSSSLKPSSPESSSSSTIVSPTASAYLMMSIEGSLIRMEWLHIACLSTTHR